MASAGPGCCHAFVASRQIWAYALDGQRPAGAQNDLIEGVDTDDDVELLCEHGHRSLNRGVPVVGSGPSDAAAGL
jgi:hypothetical protein